MKTSLSLTLILLGFSALAAAADGLANFRAGTKIYPFRVDSAQGIVISYFCYPMGTKIEDSKCEAAVALRSLNVPASAPPKEGGKNPGSLLCSGPAKGSVYLLRDANGNENSFCRFGDGSMVATSTLTLFASEKK